MVTVVDILRRAKANVVIASVEKSLRVTTSGNTKIMADKMISAAADSVHDLIILPVRFSNSYTYPFLRSFYSFTDYLHFLVCF